MALYNIRYIRIFLTTIRFTTVNLSLYEYADISNLRGAYAKSILGSRQVWPEVLIAENLMKMATKVRCVN